MCGFAGVISFSARHRLDPTAAAELAGGLSSDLAHRGPDGSGVFTHNLAADASIHPGQPQVLLVHRRLAVIDPQPRSNQPFLLDDGRLALIFNGEIYNFRELRQELSPRAWRTDCDTEVLLAAYERWGERTIDRLEGMFAFAIVDRRDPNEARVLLARDPAGQKPLFFARLDEEEGCGAIAFASELAPLRRVLWIDLDTDSLALQEYLAWGYTPEDQSIHRGIRKVLPGHVMQVSAGQSYVRRHFDSGGRHEIAGDDKWAGAVTLTRKLVAEAVEARLVADVPIGCLLSGGIDSSIVALCMSRALRRQGRRLETFNIAFEDGRYDESAHAADVARHLGGSESNHHTFHVKPDAASLLPRLAHSFGEPFADSSAIPTACLAQQTRRHVTVVLGGDGGDELFGGYDRYRALRAVERLRAVPPAVLSGVARLSRLLGEPHRKSMRSKLRRLGESLDDSAAERYGSYMRLFTQRQIAALFPPGTLAQEDPGRIAGRWFNAYLVNRDVVAAAAALDRVTYLPGDLLVKLDRCSMLYALEVRSPFMDADLLRFSSTLGAHGLLDRAGGKRLLRDAFSRSLPQSVFRRPKMGFAVPIGSWFRTSLREMLIDSLERQDGFCRTHFSFSPIAAMLDAHLSGRADHSHRLYALLMLELWWRDLRAR